MMEQPLLTPDELKSIPKGEFIVMKTGCHPMRTKLRLFLDWGITFEEPYTVPKRMDCTVEYAGQGELRKSILEKYPPLEIEEQLIPSAQGRRKSARTGGAALGVQKDMGGVKV